MRKLTVVDTNFDQYIFRKSLLVDRVIFFTALDRILPDDIPRLPAVTMGVDSCFGIFEYFSDAYQSFIVKNEYIDVEKTSELLNRLIIGDVLPSMILNDGRIVRAEYVVNTSVDFYEPVIQVLQQTYDIDRLLIDKNDINSLFPCAKLN